MDVEEQLLMEINKQLPMGADRNFYQKIQTNSNESWKITSNRSRQTTATEVYKRLLKEFDKPE